MKTATEKSSTTASRSQQTSGPFFAKAGGGDFFAPAIQAKLNIGKAGDHHEREADSMAEIVVRGAEAAPAVPQTSTGSSGNTTTQRKPLADNVTPFVQRQEAEEEPVQKAEEQEEPVQAKSLQRQEAEEEPVQKAPEQEESVQAKSVQREEGEEEPAEEDEGEMEDDEEMEGVEMDGEEVQTMPLQRQEDEEPVQKAEEQEEPVQAKSTDTPATQPQASVETGMNASKGNGSMLSDNTRAGMEQGFGADFSGVRIHTDSKAADMSKDLNAQAFTHGNDIFFNKGKFNPATPDGKTLLAHELTHTIQQGAAKPKEEAVEAPGQAEDKSASGTVAGSSGGSIENAPSAEPTAIPAAKKGQNNPTAPASNAEEASPTSLGGMEETPTGGPGSQELAATPRSPEEDPNFQALKERSKATAENQKTHPPVEGLAENAGEAASVPANEKSGQAQASQVDEMAAQEPQLFNAAGFKAALMKAIEAVLPQNEEAADNFPESGAMEGVQDNAAQKVKAEKQNAAGAMQAASSQTPDPSTVPNRKVATLQPPLAGKKPGDLEAGKAMPPARNEGEVNQPLQENSKEVDNQMASSNVTDEQLAKSEEPAFVGALDSKKTAQEHSKTAPGEFRKEEQGVLGKGQKQSENISQKQVTEMFGDRQNLLSQATGNQQQAAKGTTSERERIASEIDKIYQNTKRDVEEVLGTANGEGSLDIAVNAQFEAVSTWANQKFENFVRREMDAYKKKRYGAWFDPRGWGTRIADAVVGMPEDVNKIYIQAREEYLNDMDGKLTIIATFIANTLAKVKARIAKGRQEVKDYVDNQPAHLKKIAGEAASEIQDKFSELDDAVISKQDELIDSLAQQYSASLEEVDARIDEMKAANRGLIDKAMDAINGVIETINKLRQMIADLLSAIQSLVDVIMADPIDFMKTLFAGITQGIENFKSNVEKHLMGGLFSWLTGALGPMGITIPDNLFSLSGIFNLVMQVLGLSWEKIRGKLLKVLPAPAVQAVETSLEVIKVIREKGLDGLWEFVKDKFNDLKETVIDAIQNMIITQVIQAGIKWLLSLLIPGAGFIKAIMAIKDMVVFFVESAIMLIPALIEGIKAAAAKNFGGIAKAIEDGIGKLIPLIIGLLARLIGISGLAKKVQGIIKKIQKRIDKQVNKLIAKAKNWVKRVWGKGKAKLKKMFQAGLPEDPKLRLEMGMKAAVGLVNRLPGNIVGKALITPLLAPVKLRYGFEQLEPELRDGVWQLNGQINPALTVKTGKKGSSGGDINFKAGSWIKVPYDDGMWVAQITRISEKSVSMLFRDSRKGKVIVQRDDFIEDVKNGDILEYDNENTNRAKYVGANISRAALLNSYKAEGTHYRNDNGIEEIQFPKKKYGRWYDYEKCHASHEPMDAVTYWNKTGYKHGPLSPEVRDWMNNPKNYEFEPAESNLSRGSRHKETYDPPLKV